MYQLILASPIIAYFVTVFIVSTVGEFVHKDKYILGELVVVQIVLLAVIIIPKLFKGT